MLVVSFPDPAPLRGKEGLGTLVDFLGILCVSNHVTHAYAHAHFSNKRVIRELRIVSCPGGGVWVAVTREFERDNCVTSEILQSDWTIPNRAGVPRKSTKVPRPSFVRESREGLGPRLACWRDCHSNGRAVVPPNRSLFAQLRHYGSKLQNPRRNSYASYAHTLALRMRVRVPRCPE